MRGDVGRSRGRRRCSRSCSAGAASPASCSSRTRAPRSRTSRPIPLRRRPPARAGRRPPRPDGNGARRTSGQDTGAPRRARRRSRPSLPFARPARPPLERVWRRLKPSYDCGMLTNGPLVAELEDRIAERLGVPHVVAVSSCTSGLMLTLQALTDGRPGPGRAPELHVLGVRARGHVERRATPQFVECDPATFQIDLERRRRARSTARPRCSRPTCSARRAIPSASPRIAQARGVPVVFDAAHALGALADGRPVGGFGDAEVFSLTPTKVLVAGEGGLVATRDAGLAKTLRIGRDYGNPGDYDTRFAGLNARMSEFHAAMALESLEMLDETLDAPPQARRALRGSPRRRPRHPRARRCRDADTVDVQGLHDRRRARLRTAAATISSPRSPPKASTPATTSTLRCTASRRTQTCEPRELPVTDALAANVISLPIYTDLDDDDIVRVVDAIAVARDHADALSRMGEIPEMRRHRRSAAPAANRLEPDASRSGRVRSMASRWRTVQRADDRVRPARAGPVADQRPRPRRRRAPARATRSAPRPHSRAGKSCVSPAVEADAGR